MSEGELREKTSCTEVHTEQGNLINNTTAWNLTTDLVAMINVPIEDLKCHKIAERINAFLPIPELTMEEALDLCHKFGQDVHIAGQFNSKEDFDHYYDGKYYFYNLYGGFWLSELISMFFYRTPEEQDVCKKVWLL